MKEKNFGFAGLEMLVKALYQSLRMLAVTDVDGFETLEQITLSELILLHLHFASAI